MRYQNYIRPIEVLVILLVTCVAGVIAAFLLVMAGDVVWEWLLQRS